MDLDKLIITCIATVLCVFAICLAMYNIYNTHMEYEYKMKKVQYELIKPKITGGKNGSGILCK